MHKCDVRTLEDAFLYQLDCQLATVTELAMKKSRGKLDYARQIVIAQNGADWVKEFKLNVVVDSRVYRVLATPTQSVKDYAKQYEV